VLGGIGAPAGTVVSANASYPPTRPEYAIDGDLTSGWNSGSYSGSLRLELPRPMELEGINLLAFATPSTIEVFTVTVDDRNDLSTQVRRPVRSGTSGSISGPISIPPGTYSSIRIDVDGRDSWVMIGEVSLLTANCPARGQRH